MKSCISEKKVKFPKKVKITFEVKHVHIKNVPKTTRNVEFNKEICAKIYILSVLGAVVVGFYIRTDGHKGS